MALSFGGVGSGLPVSDWINALVAVERQPVDKMYTQKSKINMAQTTLSSVQTKMTSFKSSLQKLVDSNLSSTFDLFSKRGVSTSDSAYVTATASNNAPVQSFKVKVANIATSTTATSLSNISRNAEGGDLITALGNAQGTKGKFSIYANGTKHTFEVKDDSTLDSMANAINTANFGLTASVSNGKFKLSYDNTTVTDVKLGASDDTSNFLNLTKLSTATPLASGATSTLESVSALNAVNSKGAVVSGTAGTFTITNKGVAHQFTIDGTSTLESVVDDINNEGFGLTAKISNGKLAFTFPNDGSVADLKFGAEGDTSNFIKLAVGSYTSSTASGVTTLTGARSVDTVGPIVGGLAGANLSTSVTAGTFKIGKAEFTISESDSLDSIIGNINANKDAGVVAQFDAVGNKITLSAKDPGSTAINLQNGTSNFLSAIGLINGSGNSLASQTYGKNAKVYINDSEVAIEANSNTISSEISGLSGVTLSLVKPTETDKPITMSVTQDNTSLKGAVTDFVTKFNDFINSVDSNTGKTGLLNGETALVRIRNNLRMAVTGRVNGLATYDSLPTIGISTGAVGTSVKEDTSNLLLDANKLTDALAKNPSEVRALLIGDKEKGITGIFQKLNDIAAGTLDYKSGYFATRKDSMSQSIKDLDTSIKKGEDRVTARKDYLTKQFTAMDTAIANMKSQSSSLIF